MGIHRHYCTLLFNTKFTMHPVHYILLVLLYWQLLKLAGHGKQGVRFK
jgi:hypothetical protein